MEINTKNLIGKSKMKIESGRLVFYEPEKNMNLLNIKPSSGQDMGFQFFSKENNDLVCHIAFRNDRYGFEYEITYGTEEKYRNKGFMNEAMNAFISSMFNKTQICKIDAIVTKNNLLSIKVLKTNSFKECGEIDDCIHYVLEK